MTHSLYCYPKAGRTMLAMCGDVFAKASKSLLSPAAFL